MKAGKQAILEIKVGVFVFLLLVAAAVVIFLLGRKANLFEEQVELKTSFPSASGLRVGAPVRLAGVQVGQVAAIHFPEDPRDRRVVVDLRIRKEVLPRITTESRARIDSMGLLGDKVIDISVGVKGQPVAAGHTLPGVAPPEYLQLLDTAADVLADVRGITQRLNRVIGLYGEAKMHDDVVSTLRAIRDIVREVRDGKGLVHALLYDKRLYPAIRGLISGAGAALERFSEAGRSFARAFGELGALIRRVRKAKGSTAHALLFGKDQVSRVFQSAAKAAERIAAIVGDAADIVRRVKTGKGLLNALISGKGLDAVEEIVQNLRAATKTIRRIVSGIQEGRGTVGALLTDPTIYEDLKTMLSHLNRNRLLRSLIRYAIQRRDSARPVREMPSGR